MQKAAVDLCLPGRLTKLDTIRRLGAGHRNLEARFISGVQPRPGNCDPDRDTPASRTSRSSVAIIPASGQSTEPVLHGK
jgi:hypothetical protein